MSKYSFKKDKNYKKKHRNTNKHEKHVSLCGKLSGRNNNDEPTG